jgi:hypothetical protein
MTSWISTKQSKSILINRINDITNNNNNNNKSNFNDNTVNDVINNKIISPINYNDYYELRKKIDTITFVILKHTRNESEFNMFKSAYLSVKTFYPKNKVVIIDDNSTYKNIDINLLDDDILIESEFPGAGEILPYYYFYKLRWSENMIFIHDSMMLLRHFNLFEIDNNIKFLWEFNYNDGYNTIIEDNIKYLINNINKTEQQLLLSTLITNKWKGCFGSSCLISLNIIKFIELKYNIFSNLVNIINKRIQREALERLLSLILFSENLIGINNCSMFGSIQRYPLAFRTSEPLDLQKYGYNSAVNKIWIGR